MMASRTNGQPNDIRPLPLNLIAQAIPMLTRHELAAVTERLLDYLDRQHDDLNYALHSGQKGEA